MVYRGRVKNGVVMLEDSVRLPEGASVQVVLGEPDVASPVLGRAKKPIREEIAEIAQRVPPEEWANLPQDLSDQLDHYIYGTPKQ
jgi:hypothetical protein